MWAGAAELKALESLANEGSRQGVALPELRPLRDRVQAARKLGESVRTNVPVTGRIRRKDQELVSIDELRSYRAQVLRPADL